VALLPFTAQFAQDFNPAVPANGEVTLTQRPIIPRVNPQIQHPWILGRLSFSVQVLWAIDIVVAPYNTQFPAPLRISILANGIPIATQVFPIESLGIPGQNDVSLEYRRTDPFDFDVDFNNEAVIPSGTTLALQARWRNPHTDRALWRIFIGIGSRPFIRLPIGVTANIDFEPSPGALSYTAADADQKLAPA
jgi:hypothetical protein